MFIFPNCAIHSHKFEKLIYSYLLHTEPIQISQNVGTVIQMLKTVKSAARMLSCTC